MMLKILIGIDHSVKGGLTQFWELCDEICCYLLSRPKTSISCEKDHRDIMRNLLPPSNFQEECRMKIEYFFYCVHTIRSSEPTKIGSLKSDHVIGSLNSSKINNMTIVAVSVV